MVTKRKVLVADASKVVRASLAKQLAEHFEVREEASGESAWQTLVLDSAIVGVVSGVNLNRLDGLGLLERARDSKLARIKSLPFFLVVSSSFGESERPSRSPARGDGFCFQGFQQCLAGERPVHFALQQPGECTPNLRRRPLSLSCPVPMPMIRAPEEDVGTRTDVGVSDILGALGWRAGLGKSRLGDDVDDSLGNENPVGEQEKLDECLANFLVDGAGGKGLGILAFGLDGYDDLLARYGGDLLARTVQKFSFMIARKIRPDDVIAQLAGRQGGHSGTGHDLCHLYGICQSHLQGNGDGPDCRTRAAYRPDGQCRYCRGAGRRRPALRTGITESCL